MKQIVELVSSLDEQERAQLEEELRGEDLAIGHAWTRALSGDGETLSREQLTALLGSEPDAARSALAQMLAARR